MQKLISRDGSYAGVEADEADEADYVYKGGTTSNG
jgi:hypothetical protein